MKNNRISAQNPIITSLRAMVAGTVTGAAICAALFALSALAFVSSKNVPQSFLSPFVIVVCTVSSFGGGFITAKISRKRGLIFGMLTGLLLFLLFLISGVLVSANNFTVLCWVRLALMLLASAFGGFLAVNKASRHK